MMKKTLLLVLSIFFFSGINAQGFSWAKRFGGPLTDQAKQVKVNSVGEVFTAGYYDFNPTVTTSEGTYNLPNSGGKDIYVSKSDASGDFLWIRTFGGSANEDIMSIYLDDASNIYLAGTFNNTVDFDPGSGVFSMTSAGSTDAFLAKYDANGNFIWAKQIGGTGADNINSITLDGAENVVLIGNFETTVDFDPGVGVNNLTSEGSVDIFILKLTNDGDFIWANRIGNTFGFHSANDVVTTSNDDIIVTGQFYGTMDFDPGIGTNNMVAIGIYEAFILKLNSLGQFVFVKSITGADGTSKSVGQCLEIDALDNIYCAGLSQYVSDFDLGVSVFNLGGNGYDLFLMKLDSNGDFDWAKSFSGSNQTAVFDMILNQDNDIFLSGYYLETVDFDPGPSVFNLTSIGMRDMFFLKTNSNGDLAWVNSLGSSGQETGNSIYVDANNYVYSAGYFYNTVDFDPGVGVYNLNTGGGNGDIYIFKWADCNPVAASDVITSCDSYLWIDGINYTTSNNTATHVLQTVGGCDSTVTLDLTILSSTAGTDIQTACDSYTWIDGNTYFSSTTTPTFTLQNSVGCDSLVTLNLTILPSTSSSDVQTSCGPFIWIDGNTYYVSNNTATHTIAATNGCDSVITLDLTINQPNFVVNTITACDSYTWIDGLTYFTSTTTPTVTLTNQVGCDSTISLHLTINNSSSATQVLSACGSYTWIDCITYTQSTNTPTVTIPNSVGCDSVITLDLTILPTDSFTDVITACAPYTWIDGNTYTNSNSIATYLMTNQQGCDSIITLDLTVLNSSTSAQIIHACGPYTWIDGNTYTSSTNMPQVILTNSAGCDSLITLDLSITDIDTSVTVNAGVLSSNQAGAVYQWIDCSSGSEVPGATSQSFDPVNTGSYTVRISLNGCTDLSFCHSNSGLKLQTIEEAGITIFPNPTDQMLFIETDLTVSKVNIFNTLGQVVQIEHEKAFSVENLATGYYLLKIQTEKGIVQRNFIKE